MGGGGIHVLFVQQVHVLVHLYVPLKPVIFSNSSVHVHVVKG